MATADTFIIWRLILLIRDADSVSVCWMNACRGLRRTEVKRVIIMVADDNPRARKFWKRCGYEEIPGAVAMGIDL
jgi:hypothetical protein